MAAVKASSAHYIKLGISGEWEAESLNDGVMRFGYREAPHELCQSGDWPAVHAIMKEFRGDAGAATRDVNQIRTYYEADESAVFITFSRGLLHWCRPIGPVEVLADQSHTRRTQDGWRSTSLKGVTLSSDRLSGNLLKVQMFRGTICDVRAKDYLLRKLGDELLPEVVAAEHAERLLAEATVLLLRLLTWQDFELLVDLVFSTSGWRRVGAVGKTQKTIDMELVLPTTGERAFIQVKSQATASSLDEYVSRLIESDAFGTMFFVWHTGPISADRKIEGVVLVGPTRLAQMVIDAGLTGWLRDKVS